MKFSELQKIMEENYGADRPADIARELNVTPQAVNNWKIRDLVPYKYVRKIRIGLGNKSDENIGISSPLPEVSEQFNFKPYFKFFNKNIKTLFLIVLTITLLQLIYLLFIVEPVYVSSAKILPSNPQSSPMSKAIGIASQLGISKPNTQSVELNSAELFPDIIQSRTLAKKIMEKRITIPGSSKKEVELYKLILNFNNNVTEYDTNIVLNDAIKIFHRQIVSVYKINRVSPLINLSVKTNNKYLSKIIASLIITELDKTQNSFKMKNTLEKKYFIEQRLIQVQNELIQSENNLKSFVDKNRNILSSPALMLERERLLRDVEMRNEVYITMKTEYELIKIEEIGKRTMVAVLDPPEVPTEKSGGSRKSKLILTIFIALMIDMLIIIFGVNAKNILVKSKFLNFLFKY